VSPRPLRGRGMEEEKKTYLFFSRDNRAIEEVLQDSEEKFHTLLESAGDAILIMDGTCFFGCNAMTLKMFSCTKGDVLGQSPWRFSPVYQPNGASSYEQIIEHINSALAGIARRFEWRHVTLDGKPFDADVTLSPMYLTGRTLLLAIVRDITERKAIETALKESEEKYRTLFEQSMDAIFITTRDGQCVDVNRTFLDFFGYEKEGAKSLNALDTYLYPSDRDTFRKEIENRGSVRDFEVKVRKSNGVVMNCLLTATLRRTANGTILGYQGIIRDISDRKEMEETLRTSEARYRTIFENTGTATVIIEEDASIAMANAEFEKLSGYSRREIEEEGIRFSHFLVKESVGKVLEFHHLRRKDPDAVPRNYELFFKDKAGNVKTVFITVALIPGTKASVASFLDITPLKAFEESLQAAFRATHNIIENAPIGIYIVNEQGKIDYANPEMLKMAGLTRDEFLSQNVFEFLEYKRIGLGDRIRKALKGHHFKLDSVEVTSFFSGKTTVRNIIGIPLEEAGEKKVLLFMENITERKHHEERLAYLATHDALTGLPNRTLFNDRLQIAIALAERHGQQLSVTLFDLDRFKEVNDTLGHKVGDMLLQAVGARLTQILRKSDTLARMGGDEFLLVLSDIGNAGNADAIARKILRALRRPFLLDGYKLHVTASLGIALYPEDGNDLETLIRRADIAMYEIKQRGRNGYRRYSTSE
jgi:diguanylate cyclase (GGDEF)-like protein/PAS domain S-box-containing protein